MQETPGYFSLSSSEVPQPPRGKVLRQIMHSGAWLAFTVITGPALSASLPKARQSGDIISNTSPLRLMLPGNESTTPIESLMSISLSNDSRQLSNYSSLYDLPSGDNLTAPIPNIVCDGIAYGSDLNRVSCFDAWRYVSLYSDSVTWGPRGNLFTQYKLPVRWSSGESALRDYRNHL